MCVVNSISAAWCNPAGFRPPAANAGNPCHGKNSSSAPGAAAGRPEPDSKRRSHGSSQSGLDHASGHYQALRKVEPKGSCSEIPTFVRDPFVRWNARVCNAAGQGKHFMSVVVFIQDHSKCLSPYETEVMARSPYYDRCLLSLVFCMYISPSHLCLVYQFLCILWMSQFIVEKLTVLFPAENIAAAT